MRSWSRGVRRPPEPAGDDEIGDGGDEEVGAGDGDERVWEDKCGGTSSFR
jgi:hypothetical protein